MNTANTHYSDAVPEGDLGVCQPELVTSAAEAIFSACS